MSLQVSKSTDVLMRLTGCNRYLYKRELYERGRVYRVPEAKAKHLLEQADSFSNVPYFTAVTESELNRAASRAAKSKILKDAVKAEKDEQANRVVIVSEEDKAEKADRELLESRKAQRAQFTDEVAKPTTPDTVDGKFDFGDEINVADDDDVPVRV